MRRVSPIMFLDDIEDLRQAEAQAEACAHAEWRWLDCSDCLAAGEVCVAKVCATCGDGV